MGSQRFYDGTKRIADVSVAALALVATTPVQLAVAALVALDLGRPVLFRQVRPGLHGEPFTLVKFRTMRSMDPQHGMSDDSQRLTRFGRALRSTSLDELPGLWNVLRGDISLVGPRPLLMQYLPLYTEAQARRHEVRPGLTGLAQIRGRNALSWEERLALDVEYVERRSLALDLKILLETIRIVWSRKGVTGEGSPTMQPFLGSSSAIP